MDYSEDISRKAAEKVSERAIERLLSFAESEIKARWAKHKNKNTECFSEYLVQKSKRCRSIRNFIYDVTSADLDDIYVPTILKQKTKHISDENFIDVLLKEETELSQARLTPAIVVRGGAGCGKSLFMRNLFVQLAKKESAKIPILVELRYINSMGPQDIQSIISAELNLNGAKITKEQVTDGLKAGLFIILLDGLDEVKKELEENILYEINRLTMLYIKSPITVAGRPTDYMLSWSDYTIYDIQPLDRIRVTSLISKLDFGPESTKQAFIKEINSHLYKTHKDFLGVPLLSVIMLLTYADIGRISARRHEFYEDAFNALWRKHDARKDFQRQRFTALDKTSFLKLLTAFAASSYVKEDITLRDSQITHHFNTAVALANIKCREEDFIKDLTISTSLMIRDGNFIRFSHRSFQEYFASLHFLGLSDDVVVTVLDEIANRYEKDNVLNYMLSLNDEKVERNWILPKLELVVERINTAGNSFRAYKRVMEEVEGFIDVIRALYALKPGSHLIKPALQAGHDLGWRSIADSDNSMDNAKLSVISKDRQNILNLCTKLLSKYRRKETALEAIFKKNSHGDVE